MKLSSSLLILLSKEQKKSIGDLKILTNIYIVCHVVDGDAKAEACGPMNHDDMNKFLFYCTKRGWTCTAVMSTTEPSKCHYTL